MTTTTTEAAAKKALKVRYSFSTDGIGSGSGGLGFDEFAYFYALANGIVALNGVDFQFVSQPGGRPVMNQLLIDREVDIGVISLATLIRKHDQGIPLCILGNEKMFRGGGNSVYVREDSPIQSPSEMPAAKKMIWHDEPSSERLIVQRAILEKKYGVPWSTLKHQEGT